LFFGIILAAKSGKEEFVETTIENLEFRELQTRARAAGLFKKSNGFYIRQAAMILTLCGVSLGILVFIEGFWLRVVANSMLIAAFASAHTGFLMHETAHGEVLSPEWHPGWQTLLYAWFDFFLGSSTWWWEEKHNGGHHVYPNHPEKDPDVKKMTFVAFTREQAEAKRGFCRFTTRYQHLLLPLLLLFQPWHMRFAAAKYLRKEKPARAIVGFSLIGLHFIVYGGTLFFFLPFWHAVAFVFVHNGCMGLYLGMAFAVNHIGMPMQKPNEKLGYFREQVLTARNISGGRLVTFFLGRLNFQIEHHLFPEVSSPHLPRLAELVKRLCEKRGVPYHCVGFWKALGELFRHIHKIAQYAR
jgi:fatty acid desaturase